MKWLLAAVCLGAAQAPTGVTQFRVMPSETSAEITNFDLPHMVFVNRDILVTHNEALPDDRHQLLLWLTGTGGKGGAPVGFCDLAANLGYHVVSVMYPDDIPASTCDSDPNPNAFEAFRLALLQGGVAPTQGGRGSLSISRADSIENRLIHLLLYLQERRPKEMWDQFLNPDGSLKWPSIAVAGQSLGGGNAAFIGIKRPCSRVLCFGAPKDYSIRLRAPAAWYGDASATPKGLFFAFNHVQDPKGCTPAQLLMNIQALGLGAFGPPISVDSDTAFHHSRILYTAYPQVSIAGQESEGAAIAHNAAINTANADRWKRVWTYMLTEPAP